MTPRKPPTHDLEAVKNAVEARKMIVTSKVLRAASDVLCDRTEIESCILELVPACFTKTMPSKKRPGRMQDVYKTRYEGFPIY
jgi:hypothetical protein